MVNTYCKISIALFIFFFVCDVQSQNLDSLSIVNSKYDSILRSDGESMNTLFYKYNGDVLINNLGTYGSPFYYPSAFFLKNYNLIEKESPFNIKLYQLSGIKPYTNITYINASRKEQLFSIQHVQEFGKLLFLDFDFKKISSPGAYNNQEANNNTFEATLKYNSKKGNYEVKFFNEISRNFYEENGGLIDITDYENNRFDDARSYAVNLKSSNSFLKKYEYGINQRLDLFKLNSDSLIKKTIYLKHQISYLTQQKAFFDNDPTSSIYNEIYLDSIATVDSIYNNTISNTGFIGFRTNNLSLELFGQYDLKKYEQSYGIDYVYHNTYVGLSSNYTNKFLTIDFIGKYGIDGYTKGDIASELALNFDKKKYCVDGGFSYFLNEPDLKFVNYISNHFIWNNSSFEKQTVLDFHISFRLKKAQLEFIAESKLLTNTLYYDSLAMANQDESTNSITSFSLGKDYKLLNFHFRTAVIYQLTTDAALFPLPELIGREVIYYQKYIFKGALKFQFGVGLSYSTRYFGYAYMPAINEFYVQQNTQLGYYPKMDIFINTHLKRAQIFLKYEHVNAGNSIEKSYAVPGYPLMDKSLKFGISWNLFD